VRVVGKNARVDGIEPLREAHWELPRGPSERRLLLISVFGDHEMWACHQSFAVE